MEDPSGPSRLDPEFSGSALPIMICSLDRRDSRLRTGGSRIGVSLVGLGPIGKQSIFGTLRSIAPTCKSWVSHQQHDRVITLMHHFYRVRSTESFFVLVYISIVSSLRSKRLACQPHHRWCKHHFQPVWLTLSCVEHSFFFPAIVVDYYQQILMMSTAQERSSNDSPGMSSVQLVNRHPCERRGQSQSRGPSPGPI